MGQFIKYLAIDKAHTVLQYKGYLIKTHLTLLLT